MAYQSMTKQGHQLFEVASALQKSIRRGLEEEAMYWAVELFNSGFGEYLWKRLRIITSEDVGLAEPMMPATIEALYRAYVDQAKKKDEKHAPERLYVTHAVLLLCRAQKSRLVDWTLITFWGNHDEKRREIPDFAYDKHNARGRSMGRGWDHFFTEGTQLQPFTPLPEEQKRRLTARLAVERKPKVPSSAANGAQNGQMTLDSSED